MTGIAFYVQFKMLPVVPHPHRATKKSNVGSIVGGTVGAFILFGIILGLLGFWKWRKDRVKAQNEIEILQTKITTGTPKTYSLGRHSDQTVH